MRPRSTFRALPAARLTALILPGLTQDVRSSGHGESGRNWLPCRAQARKAFAQGGAGLRFATLRGDWALAANRVRSHPASDRRERDGLCGRLVPVARPRSRDDRYRRQAITRCRPPGRSLWLSGRRSWHDCIGDRAVVPVGPDLRRSRRSLSPKGRRPHAGGACQDPADRGASDRKERQSGSAATDCSFGLHPELCRRLIEPSVAARTGGAHRPAARDLAARCAASAGP